MAKNFRSTGRLTLSGNFTNPADLATPSDLLAYALTVPFVFSNGTGANQCNFQWTDTRSVAATSNDDIDLYGGITDAFGDAINTVSIKLMVIYHRSATGTLQIGGAANAFSSWLADPSDAVILRPGGVLSLVAPDATGYTVTSGTGDILRVRAPDASPATITYDIILWGVR